MSRIISLRNATMPLRAYKRERIPSLDLAKGFTVLFIPAIHVVMLHSERAVHETAPGYLLRFIAEWPGAQLLMFVMGMSFSFSRKTVVQQLRRALIIFVAGYLLNVFKFLLLYWLKWLPVSFVKDLHFFHERSNSINLFLVGDILQFAGIAIAVMSLTKLSKYYSVFAVFLSYVVVVGSPIFWDWHHHNIFADHFLHLLGGSVPDCFFPVIPWIIYPLTGLAIGNYQQLPVSSIKPVFLSGVFFLTCGYGMQFLPYHFPGTLFWRTYADKTIMHLGFVMMWVSMWFGVESLGLEVKRWRLVRFVLSILSFCGRNTTMIYLIQWVVIFWMLPLFGYQLLDVGETLIAMSFVYVVVFGVVLLFRKKRKPG